MVDRRSHGTHPAARLPHSSRVPAHGSDAPPSSPSPPCPRRQCASVVRRRSGRMAAAATQPLLPQGRRSNSVGGDGRAASDTVEVTGSISLSTSGDWNSGDESWSGASSDSASSWGSELSELAHALVEARRCHAKSGGACDCDSPESDVSGAQLRIWQSFRMFLLL